MTNRNNKEPVITIRRSAALFILRVILLELIFEIIYLTWRSIIHFLPFSLDTIVTLNAFSLFFFLVLVTVVQNIMLVYISLKWINESYEIRRDEIAHITGILSKTERAYHYRDIQSITIHQGFLGRLLKFGSVHLYIPTLGHDLNFNEISHPAKFVELIKDTSPPGSHGKYIFKR